ARRFLAGRRASREGRALAGAWSGFVSLPHAETRRPAAAQLRAAILARFGVGRRRAAAPAFRRRARWRMETRRPTGRADDAGVAGIVDRELGRRAARRRILSPAGPPAGDARLRRGGRPHRQTRSAGLDRTHAPGGAECRFTYHPPAHDAVLHA